MVLRPGGQIEGSEPAHAADPPSREASAEQAWSVGDLFLALSKAV